MPGVEGDADEVGDRLQARRPPAHIAAVVAGDDHVVLACRPGIVRRRRGGEVARKADGPPFLDQRGGGFRFRRAKMV